jgi:hypothetical protein
LACRFGAGRVYALEPSPCAELIRQAAYDNGVADRIVVLRERSSELMLTEPASLVVSDLRGVLPPFHRHFVDIADARERLLAPGGELIPRSDVLFAAVVSAGSAFARRRAPWESVPCGVSLRSALPYVDNNWLKYRASAGDLLCEPQRWAELDYQSIADPRVSGAGVCTVARDGIAHGLLAWFDARLTREVGFSNRPGAPEAIYGQAFFPWPSAVPLREGDQVDFELRADPTGADYTWTWTTHIRKRETPQVVAQRFRQSTFLSSPLAAEVLRKRVASAVPTLSADGVLTSQTLAKMETGLTLGEIASALHVEHPQRFRSYDAALDFTADLSERYGI